MYTYFYTAGGKNPKYITNCPNVNINVIEIS